MCVFVFGAILAHVLATLQCFEALQRNTRGAGDKLEESAPPLLVEGLHGVPEPLHTVALGRAVLEPRVRLPVVDVDLPQATHNQLRGDETRREEFRAYNSGAGQTTSDRPRPTLIHTTDS